jgi:hypothetical protein
MESSVEIYLNLATPRRLVAEKEKMTGGKILPGFGSYDFLRTKNSRKTIRMIVNRKITLFTN